MAEGPGISGPLRLRVCGPFQHLSSRKFPRRQALERSVRAMLIVVPSPSIDFDLGIFQRLKPVSVQAFVSEATIELSITGFSVGLPGRLKSIFTPLVYAH
jgi:hypothetical protein